MDGNGGPLEPLIERGRAPNSGNEQNPLVYSLCFFPGADGHIRKLPKTKKSHGKTNISTCRGPPERAENVKTHYFFTPFQHPENH